MSVPIRYLDPAGNITAVVLNPVMPEQRAPLAQKILREGRAEQVGFAVPPKLGGECRLEMMGGEFCGNAVRSYGYLWAMEHGKSGMVSTEISGTSGPVPVNVDLTHGTAFAEMPLPLGIDWLEIGGEKYPLVLCEGICHLLAMDIEPDTKFVEAARSGLNAIQQGAWGIMFCRGQLLTPVVYVRSTDSTVWESSCGSGSVACAWYLAQQCGGAGQWRFQEPGGEIIAATRGENGHVLGCMMGDGVKVGPMEQVAEK